MNIIQSAVMGPGGPAFLMIIGEIEQIKYSESFISSMIEQTVRETNLEMIDHLLSINVPVVTLEKIAILHDRLQSSNILRKHMDNMNILAKS